MAITMKHGANPTSVLQAKFAAGRGEQLGKTKLKGLDILDKQQRQDKQIDYRLDLDKQQSENKLKMLGQKQSFKAGETDRKNLFDQQGTLLEHGLDQDNFEFELSAKQKFDEEKYRNDMYDLQNNPDFSNEEKLEGKRQLMAKMAGIEPLPKRIDKSKYPEGQAPGEVWLDEEKGLQYSRGLDGVVDAKEYKGRGQTSAEKQKTWDSAQEGARNLDTGKVDTDEARRLYDAAMDAQGYGSKPEPGREGEFDRGEIQRFYEDKTSELAGGDQEPIDAPGVKAPKELASSAPEAKTAWNNQATTYKEAEDKVRALNIGTESGQIESLNTVEADLAKAKEALAAEIKTNGKQGYKRKKGEKRTKPTLYTDDTRDARQIEMKEEIKAFEEKRNRLKDIKDRLLLKAKAEKKKLQILKDSLTGAE